MFMKTMVVLTAVCLSLTSHHSLPQEAKAEPAARNAALEYWPNWYRLELRDDDELFDRARELIDQLSEFKRDEATKPKPTPVDLEPGGKLSLWLDDVQSLLDNIEVASEARVCDLGLRRQDGPEMEIAHFSPMRKCLFVITLDARRHTDAGRTKVAARRIATLIRMAEHVTQTDERLSSAISYSAIRYAASEALWLMANGGGAAEQALLRHAVDRFRAEDPFRATEYLRAERELSATVPMWLRNGGLAFAFNSLHLIEDGEDQDDAENQLLVLVAEGYLSDNPEQEAIDIQRAWNEIIRAWTEPEAFEQLRTIMHRSIEGDFGPAARFSPPSGVDRWWRMDQQARINLEALRALVPSDPTKNADGN